SAASKHLGEPWKRRTGARRYSGRVSDRRRGGWSSAVNALRARIFRKNIKYSSKKDAARGCRSAIQLRVLPELTVGLARRRKLAHRLDHLGGRPSISPPDLP